MSYDPRRHDRRSIRLRHYDYSQPGAYFVTTKVQGGECLFGEVVDLVMQPSEAGRVVETLWSELSAYFPNVTLDAFVLMPNHVHSIVVIGRHDDRHAEGQFSSKPTLGQIVGYLKHETTVRINALRGTPYARVWQRNYYERVIRDEGELERTRQYIADNPARWDFDEDNPRRRDAQRLTAVTPGR